MRTSAPALLPIFRSDLQGRLLAALFLHPDEAYSIAELAARLEAHVATVHREVEPLGEAGIVRTRRVGRNRLVGAGTDAPYLGKLAALVLKVLAAETAPRHCSHLRRKAPSAPGEHVSVPGPPSSPS